MAQTNRARRFLRRAVRSAAYPIVGAAAFLTGWLAARGPTSVLVAPQSILIVRLDLLGDVLLTMPSVEAIRATHPCARIVMLTLPYTAPLARLFPVVDDVVAVDTNRIRTPAGLISPRTWIEYIRIARRLRAEHFDVSLSMSGRMASLWSFLSGAHAVIGYAGEAYPYTVTHPVPGGRYHEARHEVEYCARLAAVTGANVSNLRLTVSVDEGARTRALRWLEEHGVEPGDQVVVIHAGSTNGSAKRWPPTYWAKLAEELQRETKAHLILVGAAGDRQLAEAVTRESGASILSAAGETSIEELMAVLQRADLVATGDSGPLHLAVALRRPLLCVYGPTDPRVYGPFRPEAPVRILRVDLPCSPCYTAQAIADCPLGDPICMRFVTVTAMRRAALELLSPALESGQPVTAQPK